jgi:hypothetical protein
MVMSVRARSWLRLVLATTLLAGVFACVTPSVPLPPPLISSLSFAMAPTAGQVVMQGAATSRHANVRFYVYNRSKGDGAIAEAAADGSFTTVPFLGAAGDDIQLYYDTPGGERSQDLCVTLVFTGSLVSNSCL